MSDDYVLQVIAAMAVVTFLLRALPFATAEHWKDNAIVRSIGQFLPPAIMFLLVAYSLKDVQWQKSPSGAPEVLALVAVIGLHLWKRNPFISIVGGTALFILAKPALTNLMS